MHLEFFILEPFVVNLASHKPESDDFRVGNRQDDIAGHLQGKPRVWTTTDGDEDAANRIGKPAVTKHRNVAVSHHQNFLDDVIGEFHLGMILWKAQHHQVDIFMAAQFRENTFLHPTRGFQFGINRNVLLHGNRGDHLKDLVLFLFFGFHERGHIGSSEVDGGLYDCEEANRGIFLLIHELSSQVHKVASGGHSLGSHQHAPSTFLGLEPRVQILPGFSLLRDEVSHAKHRKHDAQKEQGSRIGKGNNEHTG